MQWLNRALLRLHTENTLDREEKIMSEWLKTSLIDIVELIGGGTPKTSKAEYWGGNINWLSVKDFNNENRYVYSTEKTITEEGLNNSSTKLLSVRKLKAMTHGSVFDTITRDTFANIDVAIPDIEMQQRVAKMLANIDDKVENNQRINNNLEQQAQALYENIFCIHSDIDTKHISLSDLMEYAGGSQPPASEFVFSERDGYIRFVQIRDYDTDSHITYIPDSPKNKLCEEHDIMIARYGASLGRICFGINGAYNVALAKVFPKKSFFREFLRCYLSSRTFYEGINNKGGRSAQAGFNQSDINSFEIDFPVDETIVKNFECTVAPMFEQRLQLKKENQHLASLRDTLLPKLMSGELDVSNVEI